MAFVYYEKNVFGKWGFYLSADHPTTRTAEGVKRPIIQITELPQEHAQLPYHELQKLYPLQENQA